MTLPSSWLVLSVPENCVVGSDVICSTICRERRFEGLLGDFLTVKQFKWFEMDFPIRLMQGRVSYAAYDDSFWELSQNDVFLNKRHISHGNRQRMGYGTWQWIFQAFERERRFSSKQRSRRLWPQLCTWRQIKRSQNNLSVLNIYTLLNIFIMELDNWWC